MSEAEVKDATTPAAQPTPAEPVVAQEQAATPSAATENSAAPAASAPSGSTKKGKKKKGAAQQAPTPASGEPVAQPEASAAPVVQAEVTTSASGAEASVTLSSESVRVSASLPSASLTSKPASSSKPEPVSPAAPAAESRRPAARPAPLPREEDSDDERLPERVLPKVDTFQYDVELDSKEDFALATKLALLERKNQKLLDQVEELEDKLFDAEEAVSGLRRKLQVAEEEASDFQALLDQREAQNALLRQDLASLQEKLDAEIAKRNNIDAERRKFEHRIAILETEVEQNEKAQEKLVSALEEVDRLRHKTAELLNQNGDLEQLAERRANEVQQLEKKLHAEMARSREHHNKTVSDMEKLIEAEKKRGQQAIDYVRNTLKSRIQVLQLKLDDGSDTFASHKKEKRSLEKGLKQMQRIVEDQRAQNTRDARRIESLERQLKRSKDRSEELLEQRNLLESKNFSLQREVDTLSAQYDAAIHINAKLNAQLPLSVRIDVEEEVASTPTPAPSKEAADVEATA